jgi:serine/threonine protein kinase
VVRVTGADDRCRDAVLAGGPLDAARTMDVAAQVTAGLQAAHSAGLIHRDIKPSNIMFTADGTVRITDFGVAHSVGSVPLTATGMVVGSPGCIAPERVSGGQSRRSGRRPAQTRPSSQGRPASTSAPARDTALLPATEKATGTGPGVSALVPPELPGLLADDGKKTLVAWSSVMAASTRSSVTATADETVRRLIPRCSHSQASADALNSVPGLVRQFFRKYFGVMKDL